MKEAQNIAWKQSWPENFTTGARVKIGFFRTDSDSLYHDVTKF